MSAHVYAFDTLPPQQAAHAKGPTLARLYQAGYPVPYGFVILPSAFANDQLTPESWAQVQDHLAHMRRRASSIAFAVRSSAWSEDSALVSFAGEFETVINVYTDVDVREAIRTVRRSRLGERVRAYSQTKGLDPIHEVAVVVQRLVPADFSGVLFTADPITGSHSAMNGNFVRGPGDQLVSGEVAGFAFTIQRPDGQYDGPADLKPFARGLHRVGRQLEQDLGGPQDIEWAVSGTRLYLLQSRPITTLVGHNPATGEWNDSLTGDFLWTNVNLGEAIPTAGSTSLTHRLPNPLLNKTKATKTPTLTRFAVQQVPPGASKGLYVASTARMRESRSTPERS
jgi:phosphoenolpyruvate synthase/pyruvate phosphate dikinase